VVKEQIVGFDARCLEVSHDERSSNNVVTSTIRSFEHDEAPGTVNDYNGGYDEWESGPGPIVSVEKSKPESPQRGFGDKIQPLPFAAETSKTRTVVVTRTTAS